MASQARRLVHVVSSREAGTRLDLIVGSWLAEALARRVSKSAVRRLIMAGAIRSRGRAIRRAGAPVGANARLEAIVDVALLGDPAPTAERPPLAILYEDDDLIAVSKPPGMLMHRAADSAWPDLFESMRRLLAERGGEGPRDRPPYLGLHHRLDVGTSGVVLFTKRERANGPVAAQFARGEVTKIYHAIVGRARRPVARAWRVENRLGPTGSGRRARMAAAAEGARAVTEFTVLETLTDALLLEARPETGRKHQIRAHAAASLAPILGDTRYGATPHARVGGPPRVMLHAWRIALRHPATGAPLTITCPYPPDFAELLARLRGAARNRKSGD